MENRTYIKRTLTRLILLILLILSPMAGVLADFKCGEKCNSHSEIKMSMTKCCHPDKDGFLLRTAQGCEDELTFNVGEYGKPIKTTSAKNVLFSEKNIFPANEAAPKFRVENKFFSNISNSITPAIYLLDSAFLI